jgi:hypothetical protein
MKAAKDLCSMSLAFASDVRLSVNLEGQFNVDVREVWYENDAHDIMQRSIFGTGNTVEEACENFFAKARGKILFRTMYSGKRWEVLCV